MVETNVLDNASLMFGQGLPFQNLVGPMLVVMLVIMVILGIALYIYTSIAWYTIAKKLKHKKPWLAWIPFANISLMLELGGFSWAWVLLILIPLPLMIVGLVLTSILQLWIFKILGILFLVLAIIGMTALMILIIIANWRTFEKRKHPGWFSLAPLIPYTWGIIYFIAIGFVAWQDKK